MNFFSKKTAPAEQKLKVVGMNCGACQAHVSQALQNVAGVDSVKVDFKRGQAIVKGSAEFPALIQAIEKAGYSATAA